MSEIPTPAEAAPPKEQREIPEYTPRIALQTRLYRGTEYLNPDKTIEDETTRDNGGSLDRGIINRASNHERNNYWSLRGEKPFKDRKEEWAKLMKESFEKSEKAGMFTDKNVELLKALGIGNPKEFTVDDANNLYTTYFTEKGGSDIEKFIGKIKEHYTKDNQPFDYEQFQEDLKVIQWMGSIFGQGFSAEIVANFADLEAKKEAGKLDELIEESNRTRGGVLRSNILDLPLGPKGTKTERQLLQFIWKFAQETTTEEKDEKSKEEEKAKEKEEAKTEPEGEGAAAETPAPDEEAETVEAAGVTDTDDFVEAARAGPDDDLAGELAGAEGAAAAGAGEAPPAEASIETATDTELDEGPTSLTEPVADPGSDHSVTNTGPQEIQGTFTGGTEEGDEQDEEAERIRETGVADVDQPTPYAAIKGSDHTREDLTTGDGAPDKQILNNIVEVRSLLERVIPQYAKAYEAMLAEYPEMAELVVKAVPKESDRILSATAGKWERPPDKEGAPTIVVESTGVQHLQELLVSREHSAREMAAALGVDFSVLQAHPEILGTFVLLHEAGHAHDYIKNFREKVPNGMDAKRFNPVAANWATRKNEMDGLPIPSKNPSDTRVWYEEGDARIVPTTNGEKLLTFSEYFDNYRDHYLSIGITTPEQLLRIHEEAYKKLPSEKIADQFATDILSKHWNSIFPSIPKDSGSIESQNQIAGNDTGEVPPAPTAEGESTTEVPPVTNEVTDILEKYHLESAYFDQMKNKAESITPEMSADDKVKRISEILQWAGVLERELRGEGNDTGLEEFKTLDNDLRLLQTELNQEALGEI